MTSDNIGPYLHRALQVGADTIIDKGDATEGLKPYRSELGTIMIVDDTQLTISAVSQVLRGLDCGSIYTYTDPNSALQAYRSGEVRPTLVLSDLNMPGMNGFELVKEMKKIDDRSTE